MAVRKWNLLCWNIRGINSDKKWNAIRDRAVENNYDVICVQETKRSVFDRSFIHQFCPSCFDKFEYLPSNGASGGTIIVWKSFVLSGTLIFQNLYASSVLFSSIHNNASWVLTNIYAPSIPQGKRDFID